MTPDWRIGEVPSGPHGKQTWLLILLISLVWVDLFLDHDLGDHPHWYRHRLLVSDLCYLLFNVDVEVAAEVVEVVEAVPEVEEVEGAEAVVEAVVEVEEVGFV